MNLAGSGISNTLSIFFLVILITISALGIQSYSGQNASAQGRVLTNTSSITTSTSASSVIHSNLPNGNPAEPSVLRATAASTLGDNIFHNAPKYKAKVTFDYITVRDKHEDFGKGKGEWDLVAYVQGKKVDLTEASVDCLYQVGKSPSCGLGDVDDGQTVPFGSSDNSTNAPNDITVELSRASSLSIFTVGFELDNCPYPLHFPNQIDLSSTFQKPRSEWHSSIAATQKYWETPGRFSCSSLAGSILGDDDDPLGTINEIYDGPNYGVGTHEVLSSNGDFMIKYTITIEPILPENVIIHQCDQTLRIEYGVTASSSKSTFLPSNAIDNNFNTKWVSTPSVKPWIKADLGKTQEAWPVCGVAIAWADGNAHKYSFIVSVSTDGTTFTKVFSGKSSGTTNLTEIYHFPQSIARYIRVMVTQSTPGASTSIAQISELSIIGTP